MTNASLFIIIHYPSSTANLRLQVVIRGWSGSRACGVTVCEGEGGHVITRLVACGGGPYIPDTRHYPSRVTKCGGNS